MVISVVIPVLLLLGLLGYVAVRPGAFRIERSAHIAASPDAVLAQIQDLRRFNRWNPFAGADPTIRLRYSGPDDGVGAWCEWNGRKSGQGRMRIVNVTATEVVMALDFIGPLPAQNVATFTLIPDGSATRLCWAMSGYNSFGRRLLAILCQMDRIVGSAFERGLGRLRELLETPETPDAASLTPTALQERVA